MRIELTTVLTEAIDRAMDWTVAPGYGAPGYLLRRAGWGPRVPDGALDGRDVLVTGASSGIGEAAAAQLAEAGARVHMLARNRERGAAARERVAGVAPAPRSSCISATSPTSTRSATSPSASPPRRPGWPG